MFSDYSIFAMLGVAVLGALICLALPRPRHVLRLIVAVSAIELGLAANVWASVLRDGFVTAADGWFYIDAFSAFYLIVLVLVFLLSSAFAGGYFVHETGEHAFTLPVARRFGALWLGSLTAMMLVLVSNNVGIMWVSMEATTLQSAFLISLYPSRLSLEAMWKYLLICSVGIAFAFIGTIFAAASVQIHRRRSGRRVVLDRLASADVQLDPLLMKFRVHFYSGRLVRKPGSRPFTHGCPMRTARRRPRCRRCSPVFAEHRALLHHALCPAGPACLGTRFHRRVVDLLRCRSWWRPALSSFQRCQAPARLLQRRAFGHYHSRVRFRPLRLAALFHTLNHSVGKSLAFFAVGRLGQQFGSHEMEALSGDCAPTGCGGSPCWQSSGVDRRARRLRFHERISALRAPRRRQVAVLVFFSPRAASFFSVSVLRHLIDMALAIRIAGGGFVAVAARVRVTARRGLIVVTAMGLQPLLGLWMPVWFSSALGSAAAVLGPRVRRAYCRPATRCRWRSAAIPVTTPTALFRGEVLSAIAEGWRLLLLTGLSWMCGGHSLLAALADDHSGEIGLIATVVGKIIRH